ncbi:hypothetical protein AVT43_gp68 [Polaribacter phage P12002L]|uniref:Uncharacterized protein n=2 Tax=Incheonvirus TaxID=2976977 RepID=A0A0F7DD33_9CAUD|nr:hypothetical protein AVT42_gp70 [Polaribacter phage P12002S]YP_009209728.1 hypothetical protein AVT43_gp68 [Polaribacter phage P12002L]AKG94242.1 hypothetical protein P12002L_0068 [Polaribacter phage P12002L]AKG94326.1 hypothetical protein P12002S_0070 [Polaribacter phage P12002S]
MKQSVVVKEVNAEEVERKPFNSVKLAHKYYKEQKKQLSKEEKETTKFRIIQKK